MDENKAYTEPGAVGLFVKMIDFAIRLESR